MGSLGEGEPSTLGQGTNTYESNTLPSLHLDRKKSAPSEVVKRLLLEGYPSYYY